MDKKRTHEMLEMMTEWCLGEMHKGKEALCVEEFEKAANIIKDLACAEKDMMEKCLLEKEKDAMEAMERDWDKMPDHEKARYGYDRWRYSSGRFAPKGRGHETSMATATGRSGYMPVDDGPWMDEPWMQGARTATGSDVRYGYSDGRTGRGNTQSNSSNMSRTGTTSRSGFTPEGNPEEYIKETVDTMKEMFAEADPELQGRMVNHFRNMCREFGLSV